MEIMRQFVYVSVNEKAKLTKNNHQIQVTWPDGWGDTRYGKIISTIYLQLITSCLAGLTLPLKILINFTGVWASLSVYY